DRENARKEMTNALTQGPRAPVYGLGVLPRDGLRLRHPTTSQTAIDGCRLRSPQKIGELPTTCLSRTVNRKTCRHDDLHQAHSSQLATACAQAESTGAAALMHATLLFPALKGGS